MLLHRFCVAALFLVACAHSEVKPTPTPASKAPIAKAPAAEPAAAASEASASAAVTPALNPIHFDFDKSLILPEDQSILNSLGEYMNKTPNTAVTIEGHCDERGTVEYNIALGDRRAWAAKDYIVRLGVDPLRIKTISYGEAKPADPGHDEQAWSKNRRDEFLLEQGKRAQK